MGDGLIDSDFDQIGELRLAQSCCIAVPSDLETTYFSLFNGDLQDNSVTCLCINATFGNGNSQSQPLCAAR